MLSLERNKNDALKYVEGSFPGYYLYTAGIAGEKFFQGLKNKKLIASVCECKNCITHTFLPPRIFCECCFCEITNYKPVKDTGTVYSYTEVYYDEKGTKLSEPMVLALLNIDGTDTLFLHKLITRNPTVGMHVKAVWNEKRKGTLLDIKGFK